MTCVLCGADRPAAELKDLHSRDFRGQRIIVKICVDVVGCIKAATAKPPLTPEETRRARAAR